MKKVFKYLTILAFAVFSLSNANAQISKAEIRATGLTCSMCFEASMY